MIIKKLTLGTLACLLLSSCVSKKVFDDLDFQYQQVLKDNATLNGELDLMNSSNSQLEQIKKDLAKQLRDLQQERENLNGEIVAAQKKLKDLELSYSNLEQYNQESLQAEAIRLAQAKSDLEEKSNRVAELERILESNDIKMRTLKDNLSHALNAFEGRGLTIEQKHGRVYVSMENKLLFNSGSWTVNNEGRKAIVQLTEVLAQNPDIAVLIEGHTDDDKVIGNLGEGVKNNWDLSTKRALSIVSIIVDNDGVNKKNVTAAGRSEYAPLGDNNTAEGKAKNRRIEVILTPNLDQISTMLENL